MIARGRSSSLSGARGLRAGRCDSRLRRRQFIALFFIVVIIVNIKDLLWLFLIVLLLRAAFARACSAL